MTKPAEGPENFSDLSLQPTGSGVADLEIAYEQMRVAEDADGGGEGARGESVGSASAVEGETESEAHPI